MVPHAIRTACTLACCCLLATSASAQLGSRLREGERWLLGEELLSGLRSLRHQFGAGDGGFLSSFRPGTWRPLRLGQSDATAQNSASVAALGECGQIKDAVFSQIQLALQMSLAFNLQDGFLDFGFLGTQNETEACAGQTCAYTNPSSPYGLTILPLSPNETTSQKLKQSMPSFARQDMQQRNELPEDRSAGALLRRRQTGPTGSSSSSSSRSSKALSAAQQRGLASSWQLAGEEVVLVAGCLPPANASRYMAFTHYLHSLMDDRVGKWTSVFASLGDSIGMYMRPDSQGHLPPRGTRNRLNSTLPSLARAASAASMQRTTPETGTTTNFSEPGPQLGRFGGQGLSTWLRETAAGGFNSSTSSTAEPLADAPVVTVPQGPLNSGTEGLNAGEAEAQQSASGSTETDANAHLWQGLLDNPSRVQAMGGPAGAAAQQASLFHDASETHSDPYGQFTVVMMTASKDSARRVSATLQPLLARLNLAGALNLLPVGPPFTESVGLGEFDSYFMLLTRSILGHGQMPAFRQYMQGQPWRVWRVSPRPNTLGFGLLPLPLLAPTPTPFDPAKDGLPTAHVVPRVPAAQQQTEEWLRPAMYWLLQHVDDVLAGSGRARSWSLGADSGLGGAGIDWGIDCYTKRIDFCNGDNRDAQYITSIPMVTLDRPSKVLYIVGVNHAATGLASYINLAPSDPIQRLGLLSWDDLEARGSADAYMKGGPFEGLSSLFYVIAYARNCTGVPYCKEVPVKGARSLPLARGMLVLLRAYVNPLTGVGPDAANMVNFRTVVATPTAEALPRDTKPLVADNSAIAKSPCKQAIITAAVACSQTVAAAATPGANSTRREAARVIPRLARVGRSLDDSLCCNATAHWGANQCWCSAAGQQMMDALSPVPTRALLVGVGRTCSQPVRMQLSNCT